MTMNKVHGAQSSLIVLMGQYNVVHTQLSGVVTHQHVHACFSCITLITIHNNSREHCTKIVIGQCEVILSSASVSVDKKFNS